MMLYAWSITRRTTIFKTLWKRLQFVGDIDWRICFSDFLTQCICKCDNESQNVCLVHCNISWLCMGWGLLRRRGRRRRGGKSVTLKVSSSHTVRHSSLDTIESEDWWQWPRCKCTTSTKAFFCTVQRSFFVAAKTGKFLETKLLLWQRI